MEIERKFLVDINKLPPLSPGVPIIQGYLSMGNATTRIRLIGDRGKITIKGPSDIINGWLHRNEFEYDIPVEDAKYMLDNWDWMPLIRKTRHTLTIDGREWSVDIFDGPHKGLVLAEVETSSTDDSVAIPAFVKREVTEDFQYANSTLAMKGKCP